MDLFSIPFLSLLSNVIEVRCFEILDHLFKVNDNNTGLLLLVRFKVSNNKTGTTWSDVTLFRSSLPQVFCEQVVLKNIGNYTGKYRWWRFYFSKTTQWRVFSVNLQNTPVKSYLMHNASIDCILLLTLSIFSF